jgi:hypothetical protein
LLLIKARWDGTIGHVEIKFWVENKVGVEDKVGVENKVISLVRCLWLHLIGRLLHRVLEIWLLHCWTCALSRCRHIGIAGRGAEGSSLLSLESAFCFYTAYYGLCEVLPLGLGLPLCIGLRCPLLPLRLILLSATAKVSVGFLFCAASINSDGLTGDIFANEKAGSPMALVEIVAQRSVRLLVLSLEAVRELARAARVRSTSLHRELWRCLHPNGVASLVCEGSGWRYRMSRMLERSRHVIRRHIRSLWTVVLPLVGRSRWVRVIVGSVLNLQGNMSPISGAQRLVTHDLVTRLLVEAVLCWIHCWRVDVGVSVLSVVVEWVQYAVAV